MWEIFKISLKGARILFDGRGSYGGTNSNYKRTLNFDSCHIFQLYTHKGTAIILTVVTLDISTLSSTNLQILTPKRYDEQPRHFYMEVSLGIK